MARQSGFTIIEVLLFLAVSGLLFMIAVGTLNATVRATRFTDATNSLENFISQQYSDVRSGVSYRVSGNQPCGMGGGGAAQPPGASDSCIVVGRMLELLATGGSASWNTVRTYNIVANRCPQNIPLPTENGCTHQLGACDDVEATDAGMLANYCPRVLWTNSLETYVIPWGVAMPATAGGFQNPRIGRLDSSQPRINRIAIIHSPISERIFTYAYDSTVYPDNTQMSRNVFMRNNADRNVLMCLDNSSLGSTSLQFVSIGAGQSSDLITSGAARPAAQMPGGMGCF